MPPKVEIWTKEKEDVLIHLVESCPILWDVSCKDYKRVDMKYSQWHEIAKILGPSFNANTVQQRFASMRHTFMINYRKERDSKSRCSGKGTEEMYKPKWVLYDKLKFLKKTSAQATSISNLQSPSSVSSSEIDNCSQDTSDDIFENIEYLENDLANIPQLNFRNTQQWQPISADNNTQLYNSSNDNSSYNIGNIQPNSLSLSYNTSLPSSQPTVDPSTSPPVTSYSSTSKSSADDKENMYVKRGAAKKRKESLMEEAVSAIKTLSNQPALVFQNDSVEHFGNFVAARLREMQPINRKRCEEEIMKTLLNH